MSSNTEQGSVVCDPTAATVSMLSLTVLEIKVQTKVVLRFAVLLLSALVQKDKTSLSDYCKRGKKYIPVYILYHGLWF